MNVASSKSEKMVVVEKNTTYKHITHNTQNKKIKPNLNLDCGLFWV
jgi:hypothetical protein